MPGIKVSIITPVYNVEKYLPKCLDSLVGQTLEEIEIILVNDCSTDRSGAICEEYAAKDARITVLHNEANIRQGLSRNRGIDMASGEYLGFVDADDFIDADFFEKLYHAAKKHNADIAKTERVMWLENGDKIPQPQLNRLIRKAIKKDTPLFYFFTYEHTTAIYRREMVTMNNIRYPDIRNAQDDVFLLLLCLYAASIILVSGTYYYYRQHPASTISIRQEPYYRSVLQSVQLQKDILENFPVNSRDYKAWFDKTVQLLHLKYLELCQNEMEAYKAEYANEAARLLASHPGDPGYFLELIQLGITWKFVQKGLPHKFSAILFWLPKKIRDLISR